MKYLGLFVALLFSPSVFANPMSVEAGQHFAVQMDTKYRSSSINEKIDLKPARDHALGFASINRLNLEEELCQEQLAQYSAQHTSHQAISAQYRKEYGNVSEKTAQEYKNSKAQLEHILNSWIACYLSSAE